MLRRPDELKLHSGRLPVRARRWPGDERTALVVLLDPSELPAPFHFEDWLHDLAPQGIDVVRTGALSPRVAERAERAGYRCIQELTLLQAVAPLTTTPAGAARTLRRTTACRHGRTGESELPLLAAIDRAAFGDTWQLDATMLADVCAATPSHRARVVREHDHVVTRTDPVGFLISGRSGRNGYLQRLAVDPAHHRGGVATALVADALGWMRRWRCERVLVNTHVDNEAALALYRGFGFVELPDRLRVYEGTSTP